MSDFLSRRWMLVFAGLLGLYVLLPFAAPVFMHWRWTALAETIYFVYSFLCHQLPQRSFFLFGEKAMYATVEIQAAWANTLDPLILRRFIGNPEMGWKVAWSDRMVWMYGSTLLFALLWWPLRRRLPRLPWWGLILFLLPMGLDGMSHLISDLYEMDQGFRYSNAWLAALTHNALPATFYVGDAWMSFNFWMRLLTGLLFGIGVVWFGLSYTPQLLPPPGSSGNTPLVDSHWCTFWKPLKEE